MRIQCDVCEKNAASVMCCADEAALCGECDARIHAANKLANKHARVALHAALESPNCDICQEQRAFFFCLEDRAMLCRGCDVSIHTANSLSRNHKRFLVTGTRVALNELTDEPVEPLSPPEFHCSLPSPAASTMSQSSQCSHASTLSSPTSTLQGPGNPRSQATNLKMPAVYSVPTISCCPPYSGNVQGATEIKPSQEFPVANLNPAPPAAPMIPLPPMGTGVRSTGCMRKSSISEFLTDAVPGWRVDELLNFADYTEGFNLTDFASTKIDGVSAVGGDYDWTADLSLFEEQMFAMHEVPQFPPSPPVLTAPSRSIRAPKHARNRGKQDVYLPNGYDDAFVVPDMRIPSGPVSPPLPKRKRDSYHI